MPVDPSDHVPIYEQIVQHICGSVAAGVYRSGELLPSIRTLALDLVVNPNTVQRAYRELERQGLTYTRKGLGMFVAKNGGESARRRSEAAVSARFSEGIRIGRTADIPGQRIETIFQKAMANGDGPNSDGATRPGGPSNTRKES